MLRPLTTVTTQQRSTPVQQIKVRTNRSAPQPAFETVDHVSQLQCVTHDCPESVSGSKLSLSSLAKSGYLMQKLCVALSTRMRDSGTETWRRLLAGSVVVALFMLTFTESLGVEEETLFRSQMMS